MRTFIALCCACLLIATVSAAQNQSGRARVGDPPPKVHGTVHPDVDYTPPPPTLQGLVKTADVIVDGTVQSVFPSRLRDVNDPGSVETDVLFAVDRVFKGKP